MRRVLVAVLVGLGIGLWLTTQAGRLLPAQQSALLSGTGDAQSETFTARNPFTLHWTTSAMDGFPSVVLTVEIHHTSGALEDVVLSLHAGSGQSREHVDCRAGCYLAVRSVGLTYQITIS